MFDIQKFQLTPSRRATFYDILCDESITFQLTPSRRATRASHAKFSTKQYFNSRPHGGRPTSNPVPSVNCIFQLTPSRRATTSNPVPSVNCIISTHALTEGDNAGFKEVDRSKISTHALTEGDLNLSTISSAASYFNSRPHGGRLPCPHCGEYIELFQLTPSRRATGELKHDVFEDAISTHALTEGDAMPALRRVHRVISTHALTEGDQGLQQPDAFPFYFNSRPHGGRPSSFVACHAAHIFQLTPSRRATIIWIRLCRKISYFNSRPHGGRPAGTEEAYIYWVFQLTPSRRATTIRQQQS